MMEKTFEFFQIPVWKAPAETLPINLKKKNGVNKAGFGD